MPGGMTSRRPTAMVVAAVILAAAIVLQTDIAASSAAPTASRNTQSQDSRRQRRSERSTSRALTPRVSVSRGLARWTTSESRGTACISTGIALPSRGSPGMCSVALPAGWAMSSASTRSTPPVIARRAARRRSRRPGAWISSRLPSLPTHEASRLRSRRSCSRGTTRLTMSVWSATGCTSVAFAWVLRPRRPAR